jgi:hypothetical protein
MPYCGREILYPSSSMRWGLAATTDAHHLYHIDCDGFSTGIKVKAGLKWWVVGRPRDPSLLSSASVFLDGFEVDEPNNDKWDLEGVLLVPGSMLYVSVFINRGNLVTNNLGS